MAKTIRIDGLTVSEVEFYPDDGFPLSIGYMVGPDDGVSGLYTTPDQATAAHRSVDAGAQDREGGAA